MEYKEKGAGGGRERPVSIPRVCSHCGKLSLPGEIETWLGISLLARNHRVTKSVGCHKRVKPGGERKEKGGFGGG